MFKVIILLFAIAVCSSICESPTSYLPPRSHHYISTTMHDDTENEKPNLYDRPNFNQYNMVNPDNTNNYEYSNHESNQLYDAPNEGYQSASPLYISPMVDEYSTPKPSYGIPKEMAKYQFEWEVNDIESGNEYGQKENRDCNKVVGKYMVLLPDGRRQIVEYEADEDGYKPKIRYEEPKTYGGYSKDGSYGNEGYRY